MEQPQRWSFCLFWQTDPQPGGLFPGGKFCQGFPSVNLSPLLSPPALNRPSVALTASMHLGGPPGGQAIQSDAPGLRAESQSPVIHSDTQWEPVDAPAQRRNRFWHPGSLLRGGSPWLTQASSHQPRGCRVLGCSRLKSRGSPGEGRKRRRCEGGVDAACQLQLLAAEWVTGQ